MRNLICSLYLISPVLALAFTGPAPEVLYYPEEALENCIEGWVHLSFEFSPDNTATDIRVIDSEPAGTFEAAAISALSAWVFSDEQVNNPENKDFIFNFVLEETRELCLQKNEINQTD